MFGYNCYNTTLLKFIMTERLQHRLQESLYINQNTASNCSDTTQQKAACYDKWCQHLLAWIPLHESVVLCR